MIKKYHVHIYKVIAKAEIDTLAYNGIKAKEMALEAVKAGLIKFLDSDCSLIAIEFEQIEKAEKKSEKTQQNIKIQKQCNCDRERKTCKNCKGWY